MKLASFSSGKPETWIDQTYRKWCEDDEAIAEGEDTVAEDEILWQDGPQQPVHGNECSKVLEQVQFESSLVDPEAPEAVPHDKEELAFNQVSDQMKLNKLLAKDDDVEEKAEKNVEPKGHLPLSLLEAMQEKGDRFNALWRFVLRLRSGRGGVDLQWLPNPRKARRTSRTLNWHQHLVFFQHVFVEDNV